MLYGKHDLYSMIIRTENIHNSNRVKLQYGPLVRYVKLWVAHASGMPGTFSPPQRVSDPDMHHATCVTQVPWCMPGSLTSGFLWSRWRGKGAQHSRRMRNPQFYVSGKRPMAYRTVQEGYQANFTYLTQGLHVDAFSWQFFLRFHRILSLKV